MKTEDLISRLSGQIKPVRRIDAPITSFARWCGVAILSVGCGFLLFGIRPDLTETVLNLEFTWQAVALLLLSFLSALSAFLLSVPDDKRPVLELIPLATLCLWMLGLLYSFSTAPSIRGGICVNCVRDIVVLSLIPGVFLFSIIKQAAPLAPSKVGGFGMLAVAGLGALGTQFICRNDDPLHVMLWHFVPVALLGLAGIVIGKTLLRWSAKPW